MRNLARAILLPVCALLLAGTAHGATGVTELAVTFQVVNSNTTGVVCPSDGLPYEIHGKLVGPTAKLSKASIDAVTVYLHSIGWGSFYWHMKSVPSVDYATLMAKQGHVSLVYDQLGYGASGRPPGLQSCYGSEGDTAHQIVTALKSGEYAVDGAAAPVFTKVALAAQFAAAFMTEPEAYTYHDVDALIVTSFAESPTAFSPTLLTAFGLVSAGCALGGQMSEGTSGPTGYSFTPQDEATFRLFFHDANPAVVDKAVSLRHRGPCGEPLSAVTNIAVDALNLHSVDVPVLLVYGKNDVAFLDAAAAGHAQTSMFVGSNDVTLRILEKSGGALALEKNAPQFRNVMGAWLKQHGY